MNKKEYQEFMKRYEKFKKNNLPTYFWDEERQTYEYVYYDNQLDYFTKKIKDENEDWDRLLHVERTLTEALANIAYTGFYYPYTSGYFRFAKKTEKDNNLKIEIGPTHSHSFEEVVHSLYKFPESFYISKDEEKFYNEQELKYLKRVKKYLLFIGLKDIKKFKVPVNRFRNSNQKKYGVAAIRTYSNTTITDFIKGIRNFTVTIPHDISFYKSFIEFPNHDNQELVVNLEGDFKIFIEYTHEEIKTYQEIKHCYKNVELEDDTKVLVRYFKILEIF